MSPYTETLNTLIYQNSFEHVFFLIKDYFKIGQNYKHWETSAFRTKNPVDVICGKDHVYVKDLRHCFYLICASSDIINFKDHLCQLDSQQDLGTLGWECLDHRLCLHICHVQRRELYIWMLQKWMCIENFVLEIAIEEIKHLLSGNRNFIL